MTIYHKAAEQLCVELAAIRAVAEVESRGDGMLPDNRPKILFERHVFRRRLIAANTSVNNRPTDLVNHIPGGYLGGTREHDRLARAAAIDRDCALESCSWGAYQIMGYHWQGLSYPSLQAFVNAMYSGEDGQLGAFVRFIERDPELLRALRNADWEEFAKRYNGQAYAKNKYDIKMARAYRKYSGIQ